jgi:hypothetical protein
LDAGIPSAVSRAERRAVALVLLCSGIIMPNDPEPDPSASSLSALAATKGDFLAHDGHTLALGVLGALAVVLFFLLTLLVVP